jgi:hypothetical protein
MTAPTTTRDDQLRLSPTLPDRLAFATGMLLDASDFESEQLYHRGRLARALAYLHGDGTVVGLRVDHRATPESGERLIVKPGLALDRVGRLIEVPGDACLRLDRWYQAQSASALDAAMHEAAGGVVVDVFVRFVSCPRGKTPAFAAGPFDATDAVQPSRLRDGYQISLHPRPEDPQPLPAQDFDAATAHDADSLRQAVFEKWNEDAASWTEDGLAARREHLPNQDTTSVFLARLVMPATRGPSGARPIRSAADVTIDNASRRFVWPVAAVARWAGL